MSALRLCNPSALQLSPPKCRFIWPAISKRSLLGFLYYLMSIPIKLSHPRKGIPSDCKYTHFFCYFKAKRAKTLRFYTFLSSLTPFVRLGCAHSSRTAGVRLVVGIGTPGVSFVVGIRTAGIELVDEVGTAHPS